MKVLKSLALTAVVLSAIGTTNAAEVKAQLIPSLRKEPLIHMENFSPASLT